MSKTPPTITSTTRILDAVCELHGLEQPATRETVAELTGLKLAIVDDRLKFLANEGKLKRILRGHYAPVEVFSEARPISKTVLSNGMVKWEIGDFVLDLTPREDRTFAQMASGAATQAIAIESSRQTATLVMEMAEKLKKIEREYSALKAYRANKDQLDLLP